MFGEKGKFIISGGNDKSVKVWDWLKSYDDAQTSSGGEILRSSISLKRKVSYTPVIRFPQLLRFHFTLFLL